MVRYREYEPIAEIDWRTLASFRIGLQDIDDCSCRRFSLASGVICSVFFGPGTLVSQLAVWESS